VSDGGLNDAVRRAEQQATLRRARAATDEQARHDMENASVKPNLLVSSRLQLRSLAARVKRH
jgi:hypothetical protein